MGRPCILPPWPSRDHLRAAGTVARAALLSSLQDFETNDELKCKVISFLEEVMHDPELLTQERKAAANIIRWGLGTAY